jgi:thiol-disulfide isomerase/thioredoxin
MSYNEIISQELAPDLYYVDLSGSESQLSDLRGEVVYISFWASWCGPCLRNFKKYEAIRSQLASEGVILLNVNIDKTEDLWLSALEAQDISGQNVRSTDIEGLQADYQVYNIPLYEIVNRQGKLVYLPDDPDRSIVDAFIGWLGER